MDKVAVLAMTDYFLPGYKAGGPVRTIANMVDWLDDEVHFKVLTRDRDYGEPGRYPEVTVDDWQQGRGAEVYYATPQTLTPAGMARVVRATPHDLLYLNSFFSPVFTIMPLLLRRLGMLGRQPVVLAPRGEFSPGALAIKGGKKRLYLLLAKALGLHRDVVWQASSAYERDDIHRTIGREASVVVAPDLPSRAEGEAFRRPGRKEPGTLKALFISRISRKKNLDGALRALAQVRGRVEFNIYGPLEDREYWQECQQVVKTLPPSVTVSYHGPVAYEGVAEIFRAHDLFLFPTHGENYGHVIIEAFANGCPVLISDQTPWRGLEEKGIGWDLPLERPQLFADALQRCVAMDEDERQGIFQRAQAYYREAVQGAHIVEQNRRLFRGLDGQRL